MNDKAAHAIVQEARRLATIAEDEPAALFYALARRPKALGGGWRVLPALVALSHLASAGMRLRATADELDGWRRRLVHRDRPPFDKLRVWFAERVVER